MTETDTEKSSYGGFERFLFFATPIVFTIVLLGVLLAMFDTNIMNGVLKLANRIPVVEKFIPDPVVRQPAGLPGNAGASASGGTVRPLNEAGELETLKAKLSEAEVSMQTAAASIQQKDQAIQELKTQVAALEEKLKGKTQTDEEYRTQIQQLASIYANMMPSKSAPILEALTHKERVLVLSEMKPADRGKILEKMTPQIAAESSIQLKDVVSAKDLQIAALQERLDLQKQPQQAAPTMTKNDIGATFSSMIPKSAATILLEMNAGNPARVIEILKAMDNQGRAKVLAAMSDANKQTTASITAKLAE